MMDLRQKKEKFEFDGETFELTCNMNVLAEVQEQYDGEISKAFNNKGSLRAVNTFLAAMLNDYADSQGWEKRYSVKQIGRMLDPSTQATTARNSMVMRLVSAAFSPREGEESEKN